MLHRIGDAAIDVVIAAIDAGVAPRDNLAHVVSRLRSALCATAAVGASRSGTTSFSLSGDGASNALNGAGVGVPIGGRRACIAAPMSRADSADDGCQEVNFNCLISCRRHHDRGVSMPSPN